MLREGDTLDTSGAGNFTFGYFGGVMDAATGLLYVGNGQYYDPATGRFLTRNVNPDNTNPYVPWNPIGAIFAPLALLSLFYSRKRKRGKWDTLIIIALLGITMGMGVVACAPPPPVTPAPGSSNTAPPVVPGSTQSPVQVGPGTVLPDLPTSTPLPAITVVVGDCPTASLTPTAGSIDEELRIIYQVAISDDFPEAYKSYILAAVKKVDERFAGVMGWARTTAFAKVYRIGYLFNWGECDNCKGAFAYTQYERIDFEDFFSTSDNTRLVIHELGHAFDQRVCAALNGGTKCVDILNGPIRNNLRDDVATMSFLDRNGYGNQSDDPPFSGFAGGQFDWQFAVADQTNFSTHRGEVWADMFLGWVYDNLATERKNYMNNNMPEYLSLVN